MSRAAGRPAASPPPCRWAWGADCASVPDGPFITRRAYYACQFSEPIIIAVSVGGRTQLFEPGPGRHATVSLRGGRVACVLGGWNEA